MAHIDLKKAAVVGLDDLVLLPQLSDKAIMENLKLRHSRDLIYTSIGPVLLSVNPFKKIPGLYSEERIAFFRRGGKGNGGVTGSNHGEPHVFGLAEETYRTMVSEEENQCVIISGESGAGKTEASKQIMQYVSAVSGNTAEMQRVKRIILESNPLLEAFGNAKTVRNDNSSRFGKFFEIFFDRMGGPVGGRMSNFLLEKSRVVGQQKGERSFHVFYQLCRGAAPALRDRLRLLPPGQFFYLNQGGTLECDGIDDGKEWAETLAAMDAMLISTSDQQSIFDTLALILHLGQLQFAPSEVDREDAALMVLNRDELDFCATLLGVDATALERVLTWKRLEMGASEVVNVPLDMQQSRNARDAIAKTLYHHLFEFIVQSVNVALGEKPHDLMLGVLDIYGFEIFEKNGFEQFCINYVNEKLQQIFIALTLKVEQEEYVRENIPWEEIKYFNNKVVCDLIEGMQPPGLFAVIDDVCATMAKEKESVADIKMLDKLDAVHAGNPHFNRTEKGFRVKHYAGDVQYDAEGFTTRNKDLISIDTTSMLGFSSNRFLLTILAETIAGVSQGGAGGTKTRVTTAGLKMRQQASNLIKTLMGCNPHYVRTIKSNDEKRPNFIDDARVLHQVKYLGLLENVRVRRAGYIYRQYFDKFLKRFKFLSPETFPRPFKGSDHDACSAILRRVGDALPQGSWQLGQHKVFIRQPQHLFTLEELREAALDNIVLKIQRTWCRYQQHKDGILLRTSMGRVYSKAGKARRADSVFRPFSGDYLDYRNKLGPLHPYVEFNPIGSAWKEFWTDAGKRYYHNPILQQSQWERPREMSPQRILFTALVERVVNHQKALLEKEFCIITDLAIYLIQERLETVVQPQAKPTRRNVHPVSPTISTVTRYFLRKRLDLRLLSGISVTTHADTVIMLHFYQPTVPYRPIVTSTTAVKNQRSHLCECCGDKMSPAAKRQHCPGCGRLCCVKKCLRYSRPLPTLLGHSKPVRVCPSCVHGESLEPVEDVVMMTPMKTEIAALLRKWYRVLMGNKISMTISDTLKYHLFGENQSWILTSNASASISETILTSAGSFALAASAPLGIPQEMIQAIETAREQRRVAAAERCRKEDEEERRREVERERGREEEHRRIVEERKRVRAAAEERQEAERLQRERALCAQREESARIVAERSTWYR
ncbi:myosin IF [Trypanosoma rangeli]|uniref:Myosin IF n=1 Tax=Trypanosoma rangeli TaxID=5698 RepID=A0A3R7RED8_TRYRA|nr:myosin IF [Trypanosoma rangeli]RNF00969.1 myosin IF [Trypanosoma rangeli]|eukprot:RNF00969.1 myosin IF [Trypanosoma rangeli]